MLTFSKILTKLFNPFGDLLIICQEPTPKLILCWNYNFNIMSFHEVDDVLWGSIEHYLLPQKPHT